MLLRQYLRREAGGLLGWGLALPAVVFPLMGLYRLMEQTDSFAELNRMIEQLPAALKTMMGGNLPVNTLDAWLQAQVFGFVVPLMLTIYTALAALGVLTREMDGHTMDFLLALPVRRSAVILSRLGGLALNLALLHGVLLLSAGAAVALVGGEPDWRTYALILCNQYLIYTALAALLVLLTVFADDLQKGLMITLGVALAMFFLPHAIPPGSPLDAVKRLSLFYYYEPGAVLARGALPGADLLVLAAVAAGCAAGAVWLFNRKQVTA